MATSVEAKIVDGLCSHFSGLIPSLPTGMTVAYPNIDFTPPAAGYVRLSIGNNGAMFPTIRANREPIRMGIFMATVCWSLGGGLIAASELAGTIFDHYAFNDDKSGRRVISCDGITIRTMLDGTGVGGVKDAMQGDVYTEIPVLIPWKVIP